MHALDATDGAVEKALDNVEKQLHTQLKGHQCQCTKNGNPCLSLEKDIKRAGGRLPPLEFPKWLKDLLARITAHQRSKCVHFLANAMEYVANVHNCISSPKQALLILVSSWEEVATLIRLCLPALVSTVYFHMPLCVSQYYWLGISELQSRSELEAAAALRLLLSSPTCCTCVLNPERLYIETD